MNGFVCALLSLFLMLFLLVCCICVFVVRVFLFGGGRFIFITIMNDFLCYAYHYLFGVGGGACVG